MAMTVLVCDSVPVVRDGLKSLLSEAPDVTRVSATGNAVECLAMTRKSKPDVLITDLSPEGMDGIDFVHRVIRENAQKRDGRPGAVVFASDMTDRVIETLLRAGAITLLEKETGREMFSPR
ncbi:response regulator transcription factor [Streptomyces sp. NPDC051642]|uniref:response regulator n=1 Tax=Streptomyces sp. NPDC051642 TaxID=3154646 RepID=UPI003447177F